MFVHLKFITKKQLRLTCIYANLWLESFHLDKSEDLVLSLKQWNLIWSLKQYQCLTGVKLQKNKLQEKNHSIYNIKIYKEWDRTKQPRLTCIYTNLWLESLLTLKKVMTWFCNHINWTLFDLWNNCQYITWAHLQQQKITIKNKKAFSI